jgi:hypothetical protein
MNIIIFGCGFFAGCIFSIVVIHFMLKSSIGETIGRALNW